ncbi:hypothetical protein HYFRA_00013318 [Hymenoscyphus fraxineus]|uniref:Uncharacterized protein n=1 Tax=Hymenoscyphus fraxineus TaxID=746836 RepID=A0A9N9LBT0_9HELO|nr:hypothetical protein HYFRA_00013318 [Hymenoscyphus fraxineus]
MPGTVSEGPSVSLSFANNFWGKEDAGVEPLMQRMHNAKQTCDEIKSFYTARAAIEDEYARKLLNLSRKPLGSHETGTLRASLDVLRGEVEQMGKSHQNVASQMKTELDEPLAAFAGAMKERRKIVQGGIEKLLKVKVQQTNQVNKTRDKYEQECLKIKGYLAQGHMVMGQEERKNKAKLEKTQINLATSNTEYEAAVKILEETTGRWNRDWKAAADKFQDLEEERLDFLKASLWAFANIASTVCVSDDASCEKVRLSLENCEVEKDIYSFIKEQGTGQEIPDPPRYINFCRGDVSDTQSESSEDENYSVAQFQRTINPAYRSSSPQPSTYESHHDPKSALVKELLHDPGTPPSREATLTPQKAQTERTRQQPHVAYQPPSVQDAPPQNVTPDRSREEYEPSIQQDRPRRLQYEPSIQQNTVPDRSREQQYEPSIQQDTTPERSRQEQYEPSIQQDRPRRLQYEPSIQQSTAPDRSREQYGSSAQQKNTMPDRAKQLQYDPPTQKSRHPFEQPPALTAVPHDPYPMDGMTMLCRTGPPSERSSAHSPMRPSSRDSQSDYSNPTSFSSQEPPSGKTSPTKQVAAPPPEKQVMKKKSGFFQSHSPFRRKSNKDRDGGPMMPPASRNTWASSRTNQNRVSVSQPRPQYGANTQTSQTMMISDKPSASPEPVDPRANFQLNVGNNVFDVQTTEKRGKSAEEAQEELDPIAQALAELKGVTKASSQRVSADNYHNIPTPAPGANPARPVGSQMNNAALMAGMRGTPPPSYDQPVSRLGLPQPAFTSKAMQQTRQKYEDQTRSMFTPPQARPDSQGGYGSGAQSRAQSRPGTRGSDMPRAVSPAPTRRAVSPAPTHSTRSVSPRPNMQIEVRQTHRSVSPNPYGGSQRSRTQSSPQKRSTTEQDYHHRHNSATDLARGPSPAPFAQQERPNSSHVNHVNSDMAIQLAPSSSDSYAGSQYGGSQYAGSQYGGSQGRGSSRAGSSRTMSYYGGQSQNGSATRSRSKSVADVRQYNREGRPILHFARAMYMYQAAIPEELSFSKGDIMAVLRLQDDGWWEAEIAGKNGRPGLVPSNYLQNC